jgi:LacI family transcriptional regulator
MLLERPYRIIEGQIALRALLELRPRPTAVFCGNDQLAFGALIECARQNIEVPKEISIVGFDDLEYASQIIPSLTTIEVPADEIGRRAGELLLARLSDKPSPTNIPIEVNLVIRESSGLAPKNLAYSSR